MKKRIYIIAILTFFVCSYVFTQELWETHRRGLLNQSVFNTGALGSQYNYFRDKDSGDSLRAPLEWPGNSYFHFSNANYWYYNSAGGGLVMLCDTGNYSNHAKYMIYDSLISASGIDMIGCLGQGSNGLYRDGSTLFYWPGTVSKRTNFPVNDDGSWNTSYDPTEAEEIITSSVHTPYGITITRTSRAWSYPGYDSFIIYDYEFKNTGMHYKFAPGVSPTHATDTLFMIIPSWVEYFTPSYVYANRFSEGIGGVNNQGMRNNLLSRFDLRRYMQYVHHPDGRPDPTNYAEWSANGTYGGGLVAPASVGYMLLYFNYDKMMPIIDTRYSQYIDGATNEQLYVYDHGQGDPTSRYKQPWVLATTQSNLTAIKIQSHVGGNDNRPYRVWNPRNTGASDSANLNNHFNAAFAQYWYGRGKPNNNYNFGSPQIHSYAVGPYKLAPDESFHVVFAEVAGFGPGRKWDVNNYDYGGGTETVLSGDLFHPVPSWDSVITYPNAPLSISSTGGIGINYIPTYGIPDYIRDENVVTIRDVADRCIRLYSGNTNIIKYDTLQYEPNGDSRLSNPAPSPSQVTARSGGWNAAFINVAGGPLKMPYPNPRTEVQNVSTFVPGVTIKDSLTIKVKVTWNALMDDVPANIRPYVNGLRNYELLKSTSPLGPWVTLATVNLKDNQYYDAFNAEYKYEDYNVRSSAIYYYAVVSVDSAGIKNGVLTMSKITVELAAYEKLGKVYAVPNPFFLTSGLPGYTAGGENLMYFYGLTTRTVIRIFSFSGQLVKTVNHDVNTQSASWDMRSESSKKVAAGVYYFTVEDLNTGQKAWNKFIVVH